jgi:hypothetical protein
MRLLGRAKGFLLFDTKTKLLLMEAFILLGWARVLKSMPFSKVAPLLGEHMNETSLDIDETNIKLLKHVSNAVNIMSRYTIWESMCLVKAIAAMKMLERRQIGSTMYLGTAKDETGKLIAHAWLRSGPFYITGAEVMNQFVVVSKFAKKIPF